jgi:hypothetical protein
VRLEVIDQVRIDAHARSEVVTASCVHRERPVALDLGKRSELACFTSAVTVAGDADATRSRSEDED